MIKKIEVEPYNPDWAQQFSKIKESLWPSLKDFAKTIEHVGSTSVPGLAAKPIIDIDIVISDMSYLDQAIINLGKLGYEHRGNLGIKDREAFRANQPIYKHNLYVCPEDSIALRNHLCLRDSLLADSMLRNKYAELKYRLAQEFPSSIDDYIEGKTEFILDILQKHGFGPDSLDTIRIANIKP